MPDFTVKRAEGQPGGAGRDARGRFTAGNDFAERGGAARAAKLTPERRKAIATGYRALVERRFDGDHERAKSWLGDVGVWSADRGYAVSWAWADLSIQAVLRNTATRGRRGG